MIFEQFSQADSSTSRRYGGTGLGLAICKRILEEQGSALKLKSEPGKGSEFYFTQTFQVGSPLKTIEKEVSDKKKITEEQRPLQNIHVLLVEDNELNILVTRKFLENWGARVDVAINGQEAIDKLDTARHEIILMDMHMPVMDGYEATRILREKGVTVPIIALTASIPGDIKNKVFDAGANDIVIKPFDPNHLYRIILHYTRGQKE